jgi:acylphosphatase
MTGIKNITIKVKGRVQGVGYRYNTMIKARELGIKGYVKNERDGSVAIEAEGTQEDLDHFTYWCTNGPNFARVDHISIHNGPLRNFEDFFIVR